MEMPSLAELQAVDYMKQFTLTFISITLEDPCRLNKSNATKPTLVLIVMLSTFTELH